MNHRSLVAVLAAGIMFAGCSTSGNFSNASSPSSVSAGTLSASVRDNGGSATLYISSPSPEHGSVAVYSGNPLKYSRAITDGIYLPEGLALNSQQQLFVANTGGPNVTVYNDGRSGPAQTLSNKWMKQPYRVAISLRGDLYVVSRNFVNIFTRSRENKSKKIHLRTDAVVFDSSDNAYIPAGANVIDVFAPGGTQPTRTISQGVNAVLSLAIDGTGNLYVANSQPARCGSVTVYNAGAGTLENTITNGICNPIRFAFDSVGNVYVANYVEGKPGYSVTVYAAGTYALMETIKKGINKPVALAFDPRNNLYVANHGTPGSVTVYASGQTSPSQTLKQGINIATDLAWLP